MKTPLDQLALRLALHADQIGTLWEHKSGDIYEVYDTGLRESDLEVIYHYRPLGVEGVRFDRPAREFHYPPEGADVLSYTRINA